MIAGALLFGPAVLAQQPPQSAPEVEKAERERELEILRSDLEIPDYHSHLIT